MTAHARLSPSSSSRWLRCPGSVELSNGLPDDPTIHSSEGTAAHVISDLCFKTDTSPYDHVGTVIEADGREFTFDKDWAKALEPGIDRIRELGGKFYGERKVKLDRWMPGQFGTLDRGIIKKDLIVIGDLKFGSGVPVNPVENEQMMIYALGFWDQIARHKTKATKFLLIVDQPRYMGAEGGGEWYTTLDELLAFGEVLKRRAKLTYKPDARLKPGLKQCEFCPAAKENVCKAYTDFNLAIIGKTQKDLDRTRTLGIPFKMPKIESLSLKNRSFIVKHTKMVTKWLDAIHRACVSDYKAGKPVPDLKLVVGRKGARHWTRPKLVERKLKMLLGDDAYKFSLKSPTDIEKEVSAKEWKRLKGLIGQGGGKPALVDASDARPAIVPTINKFTNLDER